MSTTIDQAFGATICQMLRSGFVIEITVDPLGDSSRCWCVEIRHESRRVARRFGNVALAAFGAAIESAHSNLFYVTATQEIDHDENGGEAWRQLVAFASERSHLQLSSSSSSTVASCGGIQCSELAIVGRSLHRVLQMLDAHVEHATEEAS